MKNRDPNVDEICQDCVCFVRYLIESKDIEPENIILFGKSIGTGFATYVATKIDKLGGLILVSPFLSLKHIVKDWLTTVGAWFLKDMLNTEKNIKDVKCPIMLIHGMKDKLISYKHSQI